MGKWVGPGMDLLMWEQQERGAGRARALLQRQEERFCTELPEIAPNHADVWCISHCQGPKQPGQPEGLWCTILKGFVSLMKRALLSLETGACEAVFRFVLPRLAPSGGTHLCGNARVPMCRKSLSVSGQGSALSQHWLGMGKASCPASSVCL